MKRIFASLFCRAAGPLCLLWGAACEIHHPAQPAPPPPPPSFGLPSTFSRSLEKPKAPTPADQLLKDGYGVIQCRGEDKNNERWRFFQIQVHRFLTSTMNPGSVDHVGCREKDPGRMIFRGKVFFKGDELFDLQSGSQILEPAEDSYLEIYIYPKTGEILDFRLDIDVLNSSVRGQSVSLTFRDDKGRVKLSGQVKDKILKGRFTYQNFKRVVNIQEVDGNPGGVLGDHFIAPACQLINCAIIDEED